ncbi:hypothetical protein KDA23_04330 [Candidatus Saccharibacteria bacterium]|nr:hypothetical protein [Candidatus Saccharibacteria bacterium]
MQRMTRRFIRLEVTNQRGMTHAMLLVALVVASGVGYVGYRVTTQSGAATNYAAVCGSGYSRWGNFKATYEKGKAKGEVLYFRNASKNKMCVINVARGESYGVAKPMNVNIYIAKNDFTLDGGKKVRNGGSDSGSYKYYAGPVYVSTAGYYNSKYCLTMHAGLSYSGDKMSTTSCATL